LIYIKITNADDDGQVKKMSFVLFIILIDKVIVSVVRVILAKMPVRCNERKKVIKSISISLEKYYEDVVVAIYPCLASRIILQVEIPVRQRDEMK